MLFGSKNFRIVFSLERNGWCEEGWFWFLDSTSRLRNFYSCAFVFLCERSALFVLLCLLFTLCCDVVLKSEEARPFPVDRGREFSFLLDSMQFNLSSPSDLVYGWVNRTIRQLVQFRSAFSFAIEKSSVSLYIYYVGSAVYPLFSGWNCQHGDTTLDVISPSRVYLGDAWVWALHAMFRGSQIFNNTEWME